MNKNIQALAETLIKDPQYSLCSSDAAMLLSASGTDLFDMIYFAGKIRESFKGGSVFSCSIVNAKSGHCSQDCAYCAQSGHYKTGVSVYPMMDEKQIFETALRFEKAGATHFSMVMSGFTPEGSDLDRVCGVTKKICSETGLRVCASLGVLTDKMAKKLKEAGITNYHHNLETARSHFDKICTTHEYEDDINTVKAAKAAGFVVCSGGIMGLGESWEQRLELALTLKELDVDTIPINFLNPIPGTRLADSPLVSAMDALKSIALFRFVHPDKNITICGGREVTLGDFQSWIFAAGSNALMSGDYLTTKGRNIKTDMEMIADLGFEIKP